MSGQIPVFDGHNDIILKLYRQKQQDPIGRFINGCLGRRAVIDGTSRRNAFQRPHALPDAAQSDGQATGSNLR